MTADPIIYREEDGFRVIDIRKEGVDCIPALTYSDFRSIRDTPDMHYHPDCMELCLCVRGDLTLETPGRDYPFLPGSIFVSAPDEPHRVKSNPCGLKTYRILFRIPNVGERILGLDGKGSRWLVHALTHMPMRVFSATSDVRRAFERLFETYDDTTEISSARRVKMRMYALDLLVAIVDASRRPPLKSSERIRDITRRIRESPQIDYPIESLAKECGLSTVTFTSEFKRANGLPPHSFILNCRIEMAKRALRQTRRSVAAIAQELGFCSTQHFARTFRRIVGVNPNTFRGKKTLQGRTT